MKSTLIKTVCIAVLAASAFSGCSFNSAPSAVEGALGYHSKEIALSTWVDEDQTWLDEVETRIYDEQGKLSVVSVNTYEMMTETGYDFEYYEIVRTDVYEVNSDGEPVLTEYYLYTYHPDEYEYIDEEGNEVNEIDYRILRGETYSADDDVLRYFYDVTYGVLVPPDGDYETPDYDYYTSIIDERTADSEHTAEQYATYAEIPLGEGHRIRTEKFFIRNADDTDVELSKEFARWSDTNDPYNYLYELYHSFRGEDSADEFYYFTRYSYDDSGNVHEQADFEYTADTVPTITPGDHRDGTFQDDQVLGWPLATMNYEAEFAKIGEQQTVLRTEYDAAGNVVREENWYKGELTEYTEYTYDDYSELIDEKRYSDGGVYLKDRTTIRFNDEILYGEDYTLKETCVYKYYDYDKAEDYSDSRSSGRMIRPADSYVGLSELQIRQAQCAKLNNINWK